MRVDIYNNRETFTLRGPRGGANWQISASSCGGCVPTLPPPLED
jgi:hypothetical protein